MKSEGFTSSKPIATNKISENTQIKIESSFNEDLMWYNLIYIELKFKIEGKILHYNFFWENFRVLAGG